MNYLRYNLWVDINHPSSLVPLCTSPKTSDSKDTLVPSSTLLSPSIGPEQPLLTPVESNPLSKHHSISAMLNVGNEI